MRLEYLPIVLGVFVILVGAAVIYDAVSPEASRPFRERRRRQRATINVPGEWMVALGTISLGVSLIGNEVWRWTTIAVITGVVLIVFGTLLNYAFLREMLLFRGAARRTEEHEAQPVAPPAKDHPNLRIR